MDGCNRANAACSPVTRQQAVAASSAGATIFSHSFFAAVLWCRKEVSPSSLKTRLASIISDEHGGWLNCSGSQFCKNIFMACMPTSSTSASAVRCKCLKASKFFCATIQGFCWAVALSLLPSTPKT